MNRVLCEFTEAKKSQHLAGLHFKECATLIFALAKIQISGYELLGVNLCHDFCDDRISAQIMFRVNGSTDPKDHFAEEILLGVNDDTFKRGRNPKVG